jgi:hypothetical protein
MLDKNAFDYIIKNKLRDKVRNAVNNGKFQLFATDVQRQEIDADEDRTRVEAINQLIVESGIEFLPTLGIIVQDEPKDKRGYRGPRANYVVLSSEEDRELLTVLNPRKRADRLILNTAKQDMDYLVTDNIDDFEEQLERLKKVTHTKLELKTNEDFEELL